MDRLNDILSNAHLPARQRSPLTRRPLAEQGRRLSQQQEHNAASQPQQPPYKYSVEQRQISTHRLRRAYPGIEPRGIAAVRHRVGRALFRALVRAVAV